MSFRWKLLFAFGATTLVAVAVVGFVATRLVGRSFLRAERERIDGVLAQSRAAMERRGEATRRVAAAAETEAVTRMAIALNQSFDATALAGAYVSEAAALARAHELDLLQVLAADGTVLSSAQWEARAGFREPAIDAIAGKREPFARLEDTPAGRVLAIEAAQEVSVGPRKLYLIGGYRLDAAFVKEVGQTGLEHVLLFRLSEEGKLLATPEPAGASAVLREALRRMAERAVLGNMEYREEFGTGELRDSTAAASPIRDSRGQTLGALVVTVSGAERAEVTRSLYGAALVAGLLGLGAALLLSIALANHITAPVAELVQASQQIAAGNLDYRIPVHGEDEMARLSRSFNAMSASLRDSRERLVQAERVAAWRELARRLAHELKNPLFPLQLSIENLRRARQVDPAHFDEVFEEGTATLLAELEELKRIIARFSDFAKMPRPEPEPTDLRPLLEKTARLYEARIRQENVALELRLPAEPVVASADPQLISQAVGNLVLNALDAMHGGAGGRLDLTAFRQDGRAVIEVTDSGQGLTEEEQKRLFTPYYTTKQHGTGLGLAIVQSVVADHGGRISIASEPKKGTRFRIELPVPVTSDK